MALVETLLGLVRSIVTEAPKIIAAGADVAELIAGAKQAMDRVVERSPEFASNDDFAELNAKLDGMENELQVNAAGRGEFPEKTRD